MQDNDYKEVRFDKFCEHCIHKDLKENESPCDECLSEPINLWSLKPVKFKEKE